MHRLATIRYARYKQTSDAQTQPCTISATVSTVN